MASLRRRPKKIHLRPVKHRLPRMSGISRLWMLWSYTKLSTLGSCPLQWHYRYVERRPAPKSPLLVFGAAAHALNKEFFRVRYQGVDTFLRRWSHHWLNVCDGNWGPSGRFEKPVAINWSFPAERYVWLAKGKKILQAFFERHADHRDTGIGRVNEIGFKFPWHGLVLEGKIDRIDEFDDHVEIVDYKLGGHKPVQLSQLGSDQATLYKLGYEFSLYPIFNRKPLTQIRVESLNTGQDQPFEPRGAAAEERLRETLWSSAWYVRSLYDRPGVLEQPQVLVKQFPVNAQGEYVLWPNLPRDAYGHCELCPFHQACLDFEAQFRQQRQAPDARTIHQAAEFNRWRARMPVQLWFDEFAL